MSGDPRAAGIRRDAVVLAKADRVLGRAAALAGDFPVALRSPGFATLVWLILGQQVSVEAAEVMFRRLEAALGPVTPEGLLGLDDPTMRRCGFTRQKAGYARGLAGAVAAGSVSLDDIAGLSDRDAVSALTNLRGVGGWTAENYLIWGLGRRDIFPAHDLALRLGWQLLTGAAAPPSPDSMKEAATGWSPRRTAAAFLVWHYYLAVRRRA